MNKLSEAAFGLAIACIVVANVVGNAMSRLVQARTGRTYWPPAANRRLSIDYKEHFGPDRNYICYVTVHFAAVAFITIAAIVAALSS